MAWEVNGTPVTVTTPVDVVTISDLSALKFNQFLFHKIFVGGDSGANLTFNNNSNTVYARRRSNNGGADFTVGNETNVNTQFVTGVDSFLMMNVVSIPNEEKLAISHYIDAGATGAGSAPNRQELVYKFVPAPDADITRIDMNNTNAGDYDTDTNLSAFGTD